MRVSLEGRPRTQKKSSTARQPQKKMKLKPKTAATAALGGVSDPSVNHNSDEPNK